VRLWPCGPHGCRRGGAVDHDPGAPAPRTGGRRALSRRPCLQGHICSGALYEDIMLPAAPGCYATTICSSSTTPPWRKLGSCTFRERIIPALRKTGKIPSRYHCLRGHHHGLKPFVLSTLAGYPGLSVLRAPYPLAWHARWRSTNSPPPNPPPPETLARAHPLCWSAPQPAVCRL